MRSVRTLSLAASIAGLVFVAVVALRTASFRSHRPTEPGGPRIRISTDAPERLAGALRFATVFDAGDRADDQTSFLDLHAYLVRSFPRVHSTLEREVVGTHSLLYTWRGSDPSLPPILLAGHLDVVPVEPGTETLWTHEPFSGVIADGFIWGRGAIDDKSGVVAILEAVEMLLTEGFEPRRTVYLAFGHDEESGGIHGARRIAALLRSRGVRLEMVLDEGGIISEGILPGVSVPVALVGIAEKGFVSVELHAQTTGGHSSLPPTQSAIGIVSAAVARLEDEQMPARLEGPTRSLFERIGPELPLPQRVVLANLWISRPLVVSRLVRSPVTNAMVRTTTAPTVFHSGSKDNVLPTDARATVNFRLLPGDTIQGVIEHVERTIDDPRIRVAATGSFSVEASPVSSTDSDAFRALERSIRRVAPDTVVAPYLVVVASDARHYAALSRQVFRFLPLRMTGRDLDRMHGTDERIAIGVYEDAIRIYRELLVETCGS